jgi:hypothetical protein
MVAWMAVGEGDGEGLLVAVLVGVAVRTTTWAASVALGEGTIGGRVAVGGRVADKRVTVGVLAGAPIT